MNLLAKGGGAAGIITLLDKCKDDDEELTSSIFHVLVEMSNTFTQNQTSVYGALFVDLGLIRTCMKLVSAKLQPPMMKCSHASAGSTSAPRDNVDLFVRTLYPLLVLRKDTTIEFFKEDGMRIFLQIVNTRPQSLAALSALRFFNVLNTLHTGFQVVSLLCAVWLSNRLTRQMVVIRLSIMKNIG